MVQANTPRVNEQQIVIEGKNIETIYRNGVEIHVIAPSKIIEYGYDAQTLYSKGLTPVGTMEVIGYGLEQNKEYRLTVEETPQSEYQVVKIQRIERPEQTVNVSTLSLSPLILLVILAYRKCVDE